MVNLKITWQMKVGRQRCALKFENLFWYLLKKLLVFENCRPKKVNNTESKFLLPNIDINQTKDILIDVNSWFCQYLGVDNKKDNGIILVIARTEFCTANSVDSNIMLTDVNAPMNVCAVWNAFWDADSNVFWLNALPYIGEPYIPVTAQWKNDRKCKQANKQTESNLHDKCFVFQRLNPWH